MCQHVLDACKETGMTTPGYLIIDSRVDSYPDLDAPSNWKVLRLPMNIGDAFRLVQQLEPDAPWYGLITDDIKPVTKNWDTILTTLAQPYYLVDCHDGWLADEPFIALYSLCGNCFVWGGDLVRSVGWWALPELEMGVGQDDVWVHLICKKLADLHLRRLVMNVYVEHLQYKNNKRVKDESDNPVRDGVDYYKRDFAIFERWKNDDASVTEIADRVRAMVEKHQSYEKETVSFILGPSIPEKGTPILICKGILKEYDARDIRVLE